MKHETVLTDEDALRAHKEVCDAGWEVNPIVMVRHIEQAILTKLAEKAQPVAWAAPNPYRPEMLMLTVEKTEFGGRPLVYGDIPHPTAPSALLEAAEKALEVIQRCNPLASYGRIGTRDVDQAEFQREMNQTETALRAAIEAHKKGQV